MRLILVTLIVLLFATLALALPTPPKTQLCATTPNTDITGAPLSELTGLKFYWSKISGQYDDAQSVKVPVTEVGKEHCKEMVSVVGEALEGYYFVATAYITTETMGDVESTFSNEVSVSIPGSPGGCRLL